MSREDRRDGQRDGAVGKRIDGARVDNKDYRDGLQRGRAAETHRAITGHAGKRNPNNK